MRLEISQISKVYGNGVKALDEIDLNIGVGMFGLLGPNGAGKSSLMRTIATMQKPDSGTIKFDGLDIFENQMEFRKMLGYLPQDFGVYPDTSAEDLLTYFAKLKGITSSSDCKKIVKEVLEVTNLYPVRRKSVSGYSGGMKQRFGIAQLLLNKPKLIIVDEPTAGLDPAERHRFLNVLREIGTSNTVIFSTHIVDDVRELCHEVAIINGGKVLYRGASAEGQKDLEGKIWKIVIPREQYESINSQHNVVFANYNADNTLNVRVYNDSNPGLGFESVTPALEDLYFVSLKKDAVHV